MKKGVIPHTGKIDFSFNEEQLTLVAKRIIPNTKIEAILSSPEKIDEPKKKVTITIELVVPQEIMNIVASSSKASVLGSLTGEAGDGASRAGDYFVDNMVGNGMWIMIGTIDGEKGKREISILYFQILGTGSYSFKKDTESVRQFNPQMN